MSSRARGAAAEETDAWAASGAMALTADERGAPFGPPAGLVPKLRALSVRFEQAVAALGGAVHVDPLRLLGERAAIAGLPVGGAISCGGAARLIEVGERWLAVSLARPDDLDLVPAWLGLDGSPADPWAAIASTAMPVEDLVRRAELLGLPFGLLPETPTHPAADPTQATRLSGTPVSGVPLRGLRVVDLTSLWAGPLCGRLLAEAGASVVKVESTGRPDGARKGPAPFFALMNGRKRSVALDLREAGGRHALQQIVASADVVLEASRPRALEQLGLEAEAVLAAGRARVWVSITGHGRAEGARDRVGFGDDAAVAGGLVSWRDERPYFCADAVADPGTGLVAATAAVESLGRGGRWLLDVPMAGVAAHLAGQTRPITGWSGAPAPPSAPAPAVDPPPFGSDTAAVLAELGPGE